MTTRQLKLSVYCGQAACSTAISGLTLEMFGGGIPWNQFAFRWVLLGVGIFVSVLNVMRAALDQDTSQTNPPTAVVPINPPTAVAVTPTEPKKI